MISIDENRLIAELYYTRNEFINGKSKNTVKNDYDNFDTLNTLLCNLSGKMIRNDQMFINKEEIKRIVDKSHLKSVNNYIKNSLPIINIYDEIYKNYDNYLQKIEYKYVPYFDVSRKLSEKDFIDIVLSYFNMYGNKYYSIAKRYFDEERIHMGYVSINEKRIQYEKSVLELQRECDYFERLQRETIRNNLGVEETPEEKQYRLEEMKIIREENKNIKELSRELRGSDFEGLFLKIKWLESGYIVSKQKEYNSFATSVVAHELGHAIDAESFIFAQQKDIPYYSDIFLEVPSTVFEIGMIEYLIDNNIDVTGGLVFYNQLLSSLDNYLETIRVVKDSDRVVFKKDGTIELFKHEIIKKEDALIDEDGQIYTEYENCEKRAAYNKDGDIVIEKKYIYDYRNAIIYGLGYYTSLNLNEIRKQDIKEFNKIINNVITLRKESSFVEMVDLMGIKMEDYINGNYIYNNINDKTQLLKKRFNAYY